MPDETIDRTFTVAEACRFSLENIRGSVDVQPGEDGIIQITATKRRDTGDADRTEVIMTQAADGSVSVETCYLEGRWLFFMLYRKPCKVDYTVRLPRTCSLHLSGVSSRTTIQGIEGEISLSTVSGGAALHELSGELNLRSVSSAISGSGLSGRLRVDTVSGDVDLHNCRFTQVHGSTVSGDLMIQTPLVAGPFRFSSVSGDVRLMVPPETGCVARFSSLSGRLENGLAAVGVQVYSGQQTVQVQGGGPEVRCHSISGDLILTLPEGARAAKPAETAALPAVAPALLERKDRRRVLEKIARGELSAEEGLEALA